MLKRVGLEEWVTQRIRKEDEKVGGHMGGLSCDEFFYKANEKPIDCSD